MLHLAYQALLLVLKLVSLSARQKKYSTCSVGKSTGKPRETLDEEGVPLDHDVSWTVAAAGGAIGTALERIGLKSVSKAVPGLDKLMSFGGKELIQLAAKNPVARKHIGAVGKILRAGATEGITELLQSVVALEGIMLAGGVTDEGGSRLADSRLERYPEAAYSGVVGGGGIAAAGPGFEACG